MRHQRIATTTVIAIASLLGLYNRAPADLVSDLENYYSFDHPNRPARDQSGNDQHGTVTGTNWVVDDQRGGALEYQYGTTDVVTAPLANIDGSGFTFSMWAKRVNAGGNAGLFTAIDDTQPANKTIGGWVNSSDQVWGRVLSGGMPTLPRTSPLTAGTWTHLAFRGGETPPGSGTYEYKVFVDGQPTTSKVSYSGTLDQTVNQLLVGRQGTESWNGRLDDFRAYSRALSDAEINDLYNLDTTGRGYAYRVAFDFDVGGGPTQDGFTSIGTGTPTNEASMLGSTLDITGAWTGVRNRGLIDDPVVPAKGDLTEHRYADVLRDFAYDSALFSLELRDLAPNARYELTIFSYDRYSNDGTQSAWYQDAISGSPLYVHTNDMDNPDSGLFTLELLSDSSGMIRLLAEPTGSGTQIVLFNGIEALQVPEPMSLSLVLIGLIGLLLGRRRRR